MKSGSGFAINVAEDATQVRSKISRSIFLGTDCTFEAEDGTRTILVVNPRQIDGLMHSPKET